MDVVEIDEVIRKQVQEEINKGKPEEKEPRKKKMKVPDKTIDPKQAKQQMMQEVQEIQTK